MGSVTNSTSAFYTRSINRMGDLRRQAERLQSTLTTGSRIAISSDDPVAAARLRKLDRTERLEAVNGGTAQRTLGLLKQVDGAIESMADDMARARELAVQAASETISDSQRKMIGNELLQLAEGLFVKANSRDNLGRPLFAGQTDGPAYVLDANGSAVFQGSLDAGMVDLGGGMEVTQSITGPEVLDIDNGGNPTNMIAFIHKLALDLQDVNVDGALAARDSLVGFDEGVSSLTKAQTIVGVRLTWVEMAQDRQVTLSESRAQERSEVAGMDMASTIAQLQQTLTVLEASQGAFTKMSQLSLFRSV